VQNPVQLFVLPVQLFVLIEIGFFSSFMGESESDSAAFLTATSTFSGSQMSPATDSKQSSRFRPCLAIAVYAEQTMQLSHQLDGKLPATTRRQFSITLTIQSLASDEIS
jgi:hypothetical protein